MELEEDSVPMVYLYLTDDVLLRQRLIDNKIFVATYWPNVKERTTKEMMEYGLMDRIIPLPCDHPLWKKRDVYDYRISLKP